MQPSTRRPRSSWRTVRTLIGLAGLAAVPWLTGCDRAHHESQPEAPTFGRAGALAIQDLGTLPDGRASGATGVNARGQVVGTSATASGVHAFLWDGAMHDLGTLGGTNSFGTALNAQGQVGGWSETPSSGCRPFLWDRGAMQDLGGLGGDLVTPGACPGAFGSIVLNARGQAAGIGATASGAQHAFLWDGRAMLDLGSGYSGDPYGRDFSLAVAINNAGTVAGFCCFRMEGGHASIWDGGTLRDLGTLGGVASGARAMNDAGHVVGFSATGVANTHAFLWDGTTMHDLGALGGPRAYSDAVAINARDQVAGQSFTASGNTHAFFWDGAELRDLGTLPGGDYSQATAMNDAGQVVGFSYTVPEDYSSRHAFLWDGTTMYDLGTLGGKASEAVAINNAGDIVGFAENAAGEQHAALWRVP